MEKEQKIEEMQRIADDKSFFGRLREFYPAFALFYISVLRIILWYAGGVPSTACTFIFPIHCLTIVNVPVTVLVTFISQTLIFNLIEYDTVWPVH